MLVTPMCGHARFLCQYDGWLTWEDISEIYRQTRCQAQVHIENGTKYVDVQSSFGGQLENAIDLAVQKIYDNALLAVTLDTTGRTLYAGARTRTRRGSKKTKGRPQDPVQQAAESVARLRNVLGHGPDVIFQAPPGPPPWPPPREGEELQTNFTDTEGVEQRTDPEDASHPHTRGMKAIGVNVTGEDKPYPMPERGPASSSWDRPYPSYPGAVRYTPPSQGKSLATADRANDAEYTTITGEWFVRPPPGLEFQD
jgi:hypothetical protein